MEKTLILSYPRSGNSFVMYFIKRSMELNFINDCYFSSRNKKNIKTTKQDFEKAAKKSCGVFKEHSSLNCNFFDQKNDNLIFIVRNYKECIVRHIPQTVSNYDRAQYECKKYANNIIFYDSWGGPKKILYYEDLVNSFKKNYLPILDIINVNMDIHNNLFNNFQYHKQKCLEHYNKICDSKTYGKKKIFHSELLSNETKRRFDSIVKNTITEKYITRYFEKKPSSLFLTNQNEFNAGTYIKTFSNINLKRKNLKLYTNLNDSSINKK